MFAVLSFKAKKRVNYYKISFTEYIIFIYFNNNRYKDGKEINADARVKISRDSYRTEDYSLSLTICQPKDAGTYEVRALNSIGESQSQCKVLILSKYKSNVAQNN